MDTCRVDFEQMEWVTPMPGVRYKVYRQAGRRLRLVEFAEGFQEPDWCLNGHIGYVLTGHGQVAFPTHTIECRRGDGLFIPPGETCKHKLTVLKTIRAVLVEDA
jgi:quercetin dioxygenase-like cupin family protein